MQGRGRDIRLSSSRVALACVTALALVSLLTAAGCGGEKPGAAGKSAGLQTLQPEQEMILAAADATDGQADKVVANCGGCALGMLGRPEHALKAGDYEMHFCSEDCKTRFGANLVASIQGLKPSGL